MANMAVLALAICIDVLVIIDTLYFYLVSTIGIGGFQRMFSDL